MAKEQGTKPIAQNKKARHDYAIEDKYEAGLVLTGTEVKSLREGRASLAESFITIDRRGEMWLEGANIPEYLNGTWNNHAPKRKRKLLLHAAQIDKLARQTQAKGFTIIPLSLYFKDGRVKASRFARSRTSVRRCEPCDTPTSRCDKSEKFRFHIVKERRFRKIFVTHPLYARIRFG